MTPLIGNFAPKFSAIALHNGEFKNIDLDSYKSKQYVILLFYPLNFTFICPTELLSFNCRYGEFIKLSTEILAISVDSQYSHLAWSELSIEKGGIGKLHYPLISDLQKVISKDYNILNNDGVALRALFILDKDGIIQHCAINNNHFGRSVDECLRVLKAIQHSEQFPNELCPVDWKPGKDTIKLS